MASVFRSMSNDVGKVNQRGGGPEEGSPQDCPTTVHAVGRAATGSTAHTSTVSWREATRSSALSR